MFYMMFLFLWLDTAMDYIDSLLVARAKLCRLLLQSRDEAKWLPRPSSDKFLIRMLDNGWTVCMLLPVQGTHILKTAYCLPVLNILIKKIKQAVSLHFSTGVRAYNGVAFTRIATSDEFICCLCCILVCCFCTFHTWTTIHLKKSSKEGRGSHFASSLDWSKSLHSFAITTSNESV